MLPFDMELCALRYPCATRIRLVLQVVSVINFFTRAMETSVHILALVTESFGARVRCHPDKPWSTLYSGPFERTFKQTGIVDHCS